MARSGTCSQSRVGGESSDPAQGVAGKQETGYIKREGTGQIINILKITRIRFLVKKEV